MSPELLRRAQREARHTQRMAQADRSARYPVDYYRPADPQMRIWLRQALTYQWRIQS